MYFSCEDNGARYIPGGHNSDLDVKYSHSVPFDDVAVLETLFLGIYDP